jgi:hypothetical protein
MKKPETNTPTLNFLLIRDASPPKTESNAATTAIARNVEYVYGITGAFIPIKAPIIHPIIIAIKIIFLTS